MFILLNILTDAVIVCEETICECLILKENITSTFLNDQLDFKEHFGLHNRGRKQAKNISCSQWPLSILVAPPSVLLL